QRAGSCDPSIPPAGYPYGPGCRLHPAREFAESHGEPMRSVNYETHIETQMSAAVLYGKEDVKVHEIPVPAVGPGEVRVRVRAALTCGTDLKVYRRGYHARMIVPPAVFGHEFAGEIDAVGEGVTAWKPGDRVVAANSAACGHCFYCLRLRPELCE